MYVLQQKCSMQKVNRLKQLEQYIYQLAITIYKKEALAIEVTKKVIKRLWQDASFFELQHTQQQKKLVWLVCQQSI